MKHNVIKILLAVMRMKTMVKNVLLSGKFSKILCVISNRCAKTMKNMK